ncbi:aminoglycoside 6-adenylyltransferase [Neobacillus sp. OS1-32]|uniref:aminoglycoside 6-adenylyltransferase n=1 Tax=Neobacillus sp. OS1-32 TaxID=3070682 RepID=UPI0027DEFEA2|nr:aminoglycoside 6-adenylyltransferase [Neobacillus sp. OS1-32]WML31311.1 aminoglycoside 6-adenylyltransferase [Neobacillus sp. OS1-32]
MRSEQEMVDLILSLAKRDDRIRAVAMNGSRTNPNAPKDLFQDFDIVYLVNEMDSFIQDEKWIDIFGERIIMQTPEKRSLSCNRYPYLMLFSDGNRIDLTLIPLNKKDEYLQEDKLTVILLDKDQTLPDIAPPTDKDYWVKRPSEEDFLTCCNEFWWVATYVAKGLWRKEILYAQEHLNNYVQPMLLKMLEWQVGIQNDFAVSIGKCGKYLEKFLPEDTWRELMTTFSDGKYESVWKALFSMTNLFRATAKSVAESLNFEYHDDDDKRVTNYLKQVKELPSNAVEI